MPATPSYRRPLNSKQLDILRLIYRFRFVTSNLLTPTLKLKDPSKTNQRLRILTDQKYIGRRYKSEYRLLGKPASYHLLPEGIKALKQIPDNKFSAAVLHNIRKDFDASDQFIDRQLGVLSTFCHLSAQYGVGLRFFTQSELRKYSYFPKPLPYAYIRLRMGDSEKQFFLEVINDSQPFFRAIGRIKQYITYAEDGDWEITKSELPTLLLVCESTNVQNRLLKIVPGIIEYEDADELRIYITTRAQIDAAPNDAIWLSLSEPSETPIALLDT